MRIIQILVTITNKMGLRKIRKKISPFFKKYMLFNKHHTSLTDNQIYPNFCIKAANNLKIFNNFRRNRNLYKVCEHVNFKQGEIYLKKIINDDINTKIELIKENDVCGNPKLFDYPMIGKVAPTTLRYGKVLVDLKKLFKNLNDIDICEIGVGYGGQCRIINAYFKPNKYTLVDIKPVLMLTQMYLDNYIISSTLYYKTMNELEEKSYDLVISNFAFTELRRSIQDIYLEKVILNSKRGYITYNEITPPEFKSYKRYELLEMIPNSKVINDEQDSHAKNCIIYWGDNI